MLLSVSVNSFQYRTEKSKVVKPKTRMELPVTKYSIAFSGQNRAIDRFA
jgi:hypothetical protein